MDGADEDHFARAKKKRSKIKENGSNAFQIMATSKEACLMAQIDLSAMASTIDVSEFAGVLPFFALLVHTLLTQYSIKKGLCIFEKQGADAVDEEMRQLPELNGMRFKA